MTEARSAPPSAPDATVLHAVALSRRPAQPAVEFLLIPFGEVQVERPLAGGDFVFTREHARAAVEWFESIGRSLAIDYEHQSFAHHNTRADGLRPAAGWIGALQIRDDGLWAANVTWTDRARDLLASGEYRYFSPVLFWADEDCTRLAALGPVALTNDPAMRGVQPLAASQPDARAEIESLRRELAQRDADAFVERGMRLGKIVEATRSDWREDFLRDGAAAESKLARSPVLRPPGRVIPGHASGLPRATSTASVATPPCSYGASAVEAADLAAYAHAAAAGRVK